MDSIQPDGTIDDRIPRYGTHGFSGEMSNGQWISGISGAILSVTDWTASSPLTSFSCQEGETFKRVAVISLFFK